ncbi:hypothetical protein TNCV_1990791 [Trichonephila clavipes]|nr:hypothetical protein TNCV_1990791 [Trichonephila clavipes]
MQHLQPKPTCSRGKQTVFMHSELHKCTHVFVRRDSVRRPLQAPYDRQYPIIKRSDKFHKPTVRCRHSSHASPQFQSTPSEENWTNREEWFHQIRPNRSNYASRVTFVGGAYFTPKRDFEIARSQRATPTQRHDLTPTVSPFSIGSPASAPSTSNNLISIFSTSTFPARFNAAFIRS